MSANEILIRWAKRTDESWCLNCDSSILPFRLQQKIENREILLASCDGQLAGYLRLEFLWQKLPFIGLIEVVPHYQRRGIGAAMLSFLEDYLQTQHHPRLLSSSLPENHVGQRWHLKRGFSVCGELRGINPDDGDEVFFLKSLTHSSRLSQ